VRLDRDLDQRKRTAAAACAIVLTMWICLFSHLGALGLTGPDEPRYAWIARAMAQTGDWVTPRLYGTPWFEKPALYYWTAGVGFLAHLPNEWAARLPSAFAALIAALCIGWLGWRFDDAREDNAGGRRRFCPWSPALLAPLIFSTSVAAIAFARAATPDMLFAASLTLAMAAAAVILRDEGALRGSLAANSEPPRPWTKVSALLLFGAFVGLSVLAKGPAGIILAAGAVGTWAIATKRWRAALRMLHPYAVGACLLVALPWYVLCAIRNPDFLRVFILQHNFDRFLTPMFHHPQPFWFFLPITLLAILPWAAFLIPAARDGLDACRTNTWRDSPGFFFVCWAFFPVLFFSFSESKLPSYILPSIPALALVIAISVARPIEEPSASETKAFVLVGLTWIGLGATGAVWLYHFVGAHVHALSTTGDLQPANPNLPVRAPILAAAGLAAAAGIAIIILGKSRRRAAIWTSLLLSCVLVEIAGTAVLPDLDARLSARPVGTMLQRDLRPDRLFNYQLTRSWEYGLTFYLGRELREWSLSHPEPGLILTTPKGFTEIERAGYFHGFLNEPYEGIIFVPVPIQPPPAETH
jgi:4-amino-4-deoxy-L-arabinose transferase-like glycosyltransferase